VLVGRGGGLFALTADGSIFEVTGSHAERRLNLSHTRRSISLFLPPIPLLRTTEPSGGFLRLRIDKSWWREDRAVRHPWTDRGNCGWQYRRWRLTWRVWKSATAFDG
jgi:hypothetical protein